ncbi:MAG: hypothetical protein QM715_05925 [Nibricoccus sp.]
MKTLSLCVILVGVFASVASASADVSVVSASSALRVASVNAIDDEAPFYVLQQALSSSLSESMKQLEGRAMPVKMVNLDATSAAEELANGTCDAVVVLGETLPYTLRGKKFTSIRAVAQIGTPVRVFHFVLRTDDPSMRATLSSAFERATSSSGFQDSVGRASTMRVFASNSR